MRPLRQRPLVLAAVALAAIGLAGIALVPLVTADRNEAPTVSPHQRWGRDVKLAAARIDSPFATVSDLIRTIEPAVVQIETRTGVGSGFVLDPAGLIVTCLHCVEDDVSARVVFADNGVLEVEGVRAMSPGRDLVILQVAAPQPLPFLRLAEAPPQKGEPVVTFGSPAGLSFTFSEGSISAARTVREVERIARQLRGGGRLDLSPHCALLQFTATSMPGHSGGPVLDWFGNVLGVTSFGLPFEGRSFEFAISAIEIRNLAAQLDANATPLRKMWPEEPADLPSFDPESGS